MTPRAKLILASALAALAGFIAGDLTAAQLVEAVWQAIVEATNGTG